MKTRYISLYLVIFFLMGLLLSVSGEAPAKAQTSADPISQSNWTLLFVDSQETSGENGAATNAFDGNTGTIWHTEWSSANPPHPHEIQIDLGATYDISGFRYLPRQSGPINGTIAQYEFYVSTDSGNWGTAVNTGTLSASPERPVMPAAPLPLMAVAPTFGTHQTSSISSTNH
jgi:hypothetical protein